MLVSPEYQIELFCYRFISRETPDPQTAIEAVYTELNAARRLHRQKTKETNFRPNSRGRIYCNHLRILALTLTQGQFPKETPLEYKAKVKLLIEWILSQWEVGELRREVAGIDAQQIVGEGR